jgi:hypothetical protein
VELLRERADDAGAEQVGHVQDVQVDGLVVGDAVAVVAAELVRGLGQGLVEVRLHRGPHDVLRPELRGGRGEEVGDLVGVGVPTGVGVVEGGRVAGLRRLEQLDRDGDVVVQQAGQLGAGRVAEERLDGVADVGLVLQ